jgi:hypothetical protein
MKTIIRFTLISLVFFLALIFGVFLLFELNLKPLAEKKIQDLISQNLNAEFKFKKLDFSILKLLQLKPSLLIHEIDISGHQKIESIFLDLSFSKLLNREIIIKKILIQRPELKLQVLSNGLSVLEGISPIPASQTSAQSLAKNQTKDSKAILDSFNLESFEIRDGILSVEIQPNPRKFIYDSINLSLKNFILNESQKKQAEITFTSNIFKSKRSGISYLGILIPEGIDFKSLKSKGDLELKLFVSDIPDALRKEIFGNLILSPEENDLISLKANLDGDLMRDMLGKGDFKLDDIRLGKSPEDSLLVSSDFSADLNFNIIEKNLIQAKIPNFQLSVEDPKNSKSGRVAASLEFTNKLDSGSISGLARGSVSGIDINSFLSTFSDYENLLMGQFDMPFFDISFRGRNDREFINNAVAHAHIDIKDGSLYLLDEILAYQEIAKQILQASGRQMNTKRIDQINDNRFAKMGCDLEFRDSTLFTKNIDISSSFAKLTGNGKINPDQKLNYTLVLDLEGVSSNIPLKVRGSLEKPKIEANLEAAIQDNAVDLINSFLKNSNL